jgi:endonuclease-3
MPESLEQKRKRIRKIIARLKKAHADARLVLKFSNPLELLVALILPARTRDELVNAVTPQLFRRYRTAADWAKEKPEVLRKLLRPINFSGPRPGPFNGLAVCWWRNLAARCLIAWRTC